MWADTGDHGREDWGEGNRGKSRDIRGATDFRAARVAIRREMDMGRDVGTRGVLIRDTYDPPKRSQGMGTGGKYRSSRGATDVNAAEAEGGCRATVV